MKRIYQWITRISARGRFWITFLSICLGLCGITAMYFSIRGNRIEKEMVILSTSTEVSANSVKFLRYSERRKFNTGIYPQNVIDSVEVDYDCFADWTEHHQGYIDSLMNLKEPIDTSILGKPLLISHLSDELIRIYDTYLHAINNYNIYAHELKNHEEKVKTNNHIKSFAEVFSFICIIISSILQLYLAFCSYCNEKNSIGKTNKE